MLDPLGKVSLRASTTSYKGREGVNDVANIAYGLYWTQESWSLKFNTCTYRFFFRGGGIRPPLRILCPPLEIPKKIVLK